MSRPRVVITGMGIFCPTGNTVAEAWANAKAGRSGIGPITLFDSSLTANKIAGEVKGFDPEPYMSKKESRRTDRATHLAVASAKEALQDSGLAIDDSNRDDVGCIIGSGIGGIQSFAETVMDMAQKGHRGVSALAIPKILIDSASGRVSLELGLRGPNMNITTACATGNNCIGEAAEIIRRGQAVVMLAGSTEAAIMPMAIAGFNNMKALTQRNDEPEKASRPFDQDRDGFVPAEGAATLVLELLEHAQARGARIYGEVLGYGHTSDAYHVTAPIESGEGAALAMKKAIKDAGLKPEDISYINAHGTSTELNDAAETRAIKTALGEHAYSIPISSTKSVTGHALGAAGTIEAVFCIMALCEQYVPPTINLDNPDPACDLNYVPHVGQSHTMQYVMSNGFGFGGHNAVIILGRYDDHGRN